MPATPEGDGGPHGSGGAPGQGRAGPRVIPPPVTRHVVVPVSVEEEVVRIPHSLLTGPLQTRVPAPDYVDRLARDLDRMEQAADWHNLTVSILRYLRWPTMLMLMLAEWDRLRRIRLRRLQRQQYDEGRAVRQRLD